MRTASSLPLDAQDGIAAVIEKTKTTGITMAQVREMTGWSKTGGLYALSGLGRFTMARFELVSAAEAGCWPSRRRRSPALSPPKN